MCSRRSFKQLIYARGPAEIDSKLGPSVVALWAFSVELIIAYGFLLDPRKPRWSRSFGDGTIFAAAPNSEAIRFGFPLLAMNSADPCVQQNNARSAALSYV